MGACLSSSDKELSTKDEKASAAIDRQIEDDARRLKKECKILLLGSGESGKTTVVKQMKIIHQAGYTMEERIMFRTTIFKNVLDGAKAICEAIEKLDIQLADSNAPVSNLLPFGTKSRTLTMLGCHGSNSTLLVGHRSRSCV